MNLSQRVNELALSPTRRYLALAGEMEKQGKRVLRLSIGQPDIPAPHAYFEALRQIPEGAVGYPNGTGVIQLREAQSKYYQAQGIDYAPGDIFITNGATEAIQFALLSLCNPGDAVLLIEPYYTNYGMLTQVLGVEVVSVTATIENNYAVPSAETLEAAYQPNLRAILFSNPGNPTGRVYTREEVQRIVDFAHAHDLVILSDEVYREFNFSGREFVSVYDFPKIRNQLVLLDSASKKFALCGARIGSLATTIPDLQNAFLKLCQMRLGVSSTEQKAVAALAELDEAYFEGVRSLYRSRRDALEEALREIPEISFSSPEGAFYTIVRLPVENADDFVPWLLRDFSLDGETALLTPVADFYHTKGAGFNEVRISYCVDAEILRRAIRIVGEGLKQYPNRLAQ